MKFPLPPLVCCVLLGMALPLLAQTAAAPKTDKEKLGYALGVDVAQALKRQPIEFDGGQFAAAVRDVLLGGKQQMTDEQVHDLLISFAKEMRAKQPAASAQPPDPDAAERMQAATAQNAAIAEKNRKAGENFLAANGAKPGVKTLADGLQYKVIKEGAGALPKATDQVTVKYRGTLLDGTVFDDSEQHRDGAVPPGTATFHVNEVIAGWTEALQKMKTGAKWQLFIPAALAYGDRGARDTIAPGSTLVFDVELVSIGK